MRAIVLDRFGEPAEVLRVAEKDAPEPGPGQVAVRMKMRSVNPAGLLLVRGLDASRPPLPLHPGNEGMGVITAVGAGVDALRPGQRVICFGNSGTWQEVFVTGAAQVLAAPDAMADEACAQAITNPLSAWLMTRRLALQPGQWLLQTAAASVLGRIVIQIGALEGFRTVNIVRRRDQIAALEALGADAVISTDAAQDIAGDLAAQVREITGGAAAAALDAVGGEVAGTCLHALADGGRLVVYGLLSGQPGRFDNGEMIFRRLAIEGFWLRPWFLEADSAERGRVIDALFRHLGNGDIALPV